MEPVFLPFLNASSAQNWKKITIYKSKYRAVREHYAMVSQRYKADQNIMYFDCSAPFRDITSV